MTIFRMVNFLTIMDKSRNYWIQSFPKALHNIMYVGWVCSLISHACQVPKLQIIIKHLFCYSPLKSRRVN